MRGKLVPIPISTNNTLRSGSRRSGWASALPAAVDLHRIMSVGCARVELLGTAAGGDELGAVRIALFDPSAAGAVGGEAASISPRRNAIMHRLLSSQPPPLGQRGPLLLQNVGTFPVALGISLLPGTVIATGTSAAQRQARQPTLALPQVRVGLSLSQHAMITTVLGGTKARGSAIHVVQLVGALPLPLDGRGGRADAKSACPTTVNVSKARGSGERERRRAAGRVVSISRGQGITSFTTIPVIVPPKSTSDNSLTFGGSHGSGGTTVPTMWRLWLQLALLLSRLPPAVTASVIRLPFSIRYLGLVATVVLHAAAARTMGL